MAFVPLVILGAAVLAGALAGGVLLAVRWEAQRALARRREERALRGDEAGFLAYLEREITRVEHEPTPEERRHL